jgi:DNA ligase (NAD+)
VNSLPDLYSLTIPQIAELNHMGEKSAKKIVDSVHASKERGLTRVLTSMGIRHIGERNARLLAGEFGDIHALVSASQERLAEIPGIGPIVADSVFSFFKSQAGMEIIRSLENHGLKMTEEIQAKSTAGHPQFFGKTFVITGTMNHFSRLEMEEQIHQFGGKTSGSVSKKTSYVIAGIDPGSKIEKAKALGIPIASEDEFEQWLAE